MVMIFEQLDTKKKLTLDVNDILEAARQKENHFNELKGKNQDLNRDEEHGEESKVANTKIEEQKPTALKDVFIQDLIDYFKHPARAKPDQQLTPDQFFNLVMALYE